MEDMERYSDYNEYEDDAPKSKNPVTLIIKILIAIVCFSVIGMLIFRMIFFNYYPAAMKNIYFTDELLSYYEKTDGEINAQTQSLRAPYDDPDYANFFCDNLIIIKGAGELQLSVRFNSAALERMIAASEYETLVRDDPDLLTFRLVDNYGFVYDAVAYKEYDKSLFYNYYKLVFSGIEFEDYANGDFPKLHEFTYKNELGKYVTETIETAGKHPEWIRLEIFVKGQKTEIDEGGMKVPFAAVAVYENNSSYNKFTPYELSDKELPK